MTAHFEMQGHEKAVLVIRPDHGIEAMLAALFIRYDANAFYVSVERYEDGQINSLTFIASDNA